MNKAIQPILALVLIGSMIGCAGTRVAGTSARLGPYKQADLVLGPLMRNGAEYADWKRQYKKLSREEQILYCIEQLQNERYHEFGSYGRLPDKLYTSDPEGSPRAELIKIGKDAIPYLIAALDGNDKTEIMPSRFATSPWLVQDAALDVIQSIACREFPYAAGRDSSETPYLAALSEDEHNKLRATIQTWWDTNKDANEVSWAGAALMSDPKEGWSWWAVRYLYARIGAKSYPMLIRAYDRLPRGTDAYDRWDMVTSQKENILHTLCEDPSPDQREFLLRALRDKPFSVRLLAARCLWVLQDKTGLDSILTETEEKILPAWGDEWMRDYAANLVGFFSWCGTQEAKEMIARCLDARNPYLRKSAIYTVPDLKMERAARKLPGLFDDPYVLGGSHQSTMGDKTITVPPRQICDVAAQAFNKVVPQSPRFAGKTDKEQE